MPKISELNAIASVANTDLLMVVHDPNGSPSTNKITVNNFITSVSTQLRGYTGSIGIGYTGSAGTGGGGGNGYTGSAGSTGFTGSAGTNGTNGTNGTAGFTGSAGSLGYTGSSGVGYTGSAGQLPSAGQEGQIIYSNGTVSQWKFNPDVRAIGAIYETTQYTATKDDSILLVVPATQGQPITVTLPGSVPVGKVYTIRNIDSAGGNYAVIVNTIGVNGLLEHPHFGTTTNSYSIQYTGDSESWVFDGNYYRNISPLSNSPLFRISANSFHQVILQNTSDANNASGDWVAYNNEGDYLNGTGPFIDMGINSNNYTDTYYGNVWGPSDSYLYNTGGNLIIGPQTDHSIKFIAGNTNVENIRFVVNSTSTYIANGALTFPDNTTQNTAYTKTKTLTTVSGLSPTAITNDITFGDPNAAGGNVTLILPSSPATGSVYTVKNINAGGFNVYVQTNGVNSMETESGSIGSGVYATLSTSGSFLTWVYDGSSTTYRIIG